MSFPYVGTGTVSSPTPVMFAADSAAAQIRRGEALESQLRADLAAAQPREAGRVRERRRRIVCGGDERGAHADAAGPRREEVELHRHLRC